jgi:hypothetical protein
VSGNREGTRSQLAAGTPWVIPGLVLEPPKETPGEKRKRKWQAAKAAKATKTTQVAKASDTTEGAKIMLMVKGPPKSTGVIPKPKSSTTPRQKTSKAGQGSSHEEKVPGGNKSPLGTRKKMSFFFCIFVQGP